MLRHGWDGGTPRKGGYCTGTPGQVYLKEGMSLIARAGELQYPLMGRRNYAAGVSCPLLTINSHAMWAV